MYNWILVDITTVQLILQLLTTTKTNIETTTAIATTAALMLCFDQQRPILNGTGLKTDRRTDKMGGQVGGRTGWTDGKTEIQ